MSINPRLLEIGSSPIMPTESQVSNNPDVEFRLDREWTKQAFMVSDSQLDEDSDIKNRYWSSASAKFTDTRFGGNIGINARPQYCWYSDIRHPGRLSGRSDVTVTNTTANTGMGRQYSEYLDDYDQVIYLSFGDPQFNSLTNFLANAFDSEMASLARTGRAPSIFYTLGKTVGTAIPVIAFPALAITIIAGKTINYFFGRSTHKFYTMKPNMHKYWSMVQVLTNSFMVNRGIFPKVLNDTALGNNQEVAAQKNAKPFVLDQGYMDELHKLLPEMFSSNNFLDVHAIANRAQRMANKLFNEDFDALNQGTSTDYAGYVKKTLTGDGTKPTYIANADGSPTLSSLLNRYASFVKWFGYEEGKERLEVDPRIDTENPEGKERGPGPWLKQFAEHLDAEFRDGSRFACFRVDYTGPTTESFSNSVVESDLSNKLNGISSQVRQARFSFSEGNIAGGVVGLIGDAVGAIKDVALGALDGATFGFSNVLMGLAGNGYIDIPKTWQSSNVQLPQANYRIQLRSPYGNVFSEMQNVYVPLFMLLAGVMPQSTGKMSYTSPLLCQLYDRGKVQTSLGMITQMTIQRGTGNQGYGIGGNALGIDVSFTITDLSSIMHMPVGSGQLTKVDMTIDEDNILADYLAVLASQDIYSQVYPMPRAKLRAAKLAMGANKFVSPAFMSSAVFDSTTSGMMKFVTGPLVAAVQGSSVFGTGGVQ